MVLSSIAIGPPGSSLELQNLNPFKNENQNSTDSESATESESAFFFLKIIYLFILFMAVLGLRFCARALSSCGKWGPLFIAVRGPLIIAASLVVERRLQTCRLSNCGSRA